MAMLAVDATIMRGARKYRKIATEIVRTHAKPDQMGIPQIVHALTSGYIEG